MFDLFHDLLASLIAFIQAHAAWAAPIAFVLAFLKSLAFVAMVAAWAEVFT